MARFTQYPAASVTDYTDATTFLIANQDGEIKQASLDGLLTNYGCDIRCASLTIASADVLKLNSTPLTIVAAQGAGTAIEVISASASLTYGSVQYATNTILHLIATGGNDAQVEWSSVFLSTSSNSIGRSVDVSDKSNLIENAPLTVSVATGNPTAGDSDITVYVLYRVITD